jgi:hypothetical protein
VNSGAAALVTVTLLRDTRTGLYFQAAEKWTDKPSRACDFHFIDRALPFVETWGLQDVELVFGFKEPDSVTTVCRMASSF